MKPKIIGFLLLVIVFSPLFANITQAISSEEVQKIEPEIPITPNAKSGNDLLSEMYPIIIDMIMTEAKPKIAKYNYDQSRESLIAVTQLINQFHTIPEAQKRIEKHLLKILQSNTTLEGTQFICKQLSLIGTEQSVPVLAKMLKKDETISDAARYALEQIPTAAAGKALRKALTETSGKQKIGIINSIGQRRDKKAATALGSLLGDRDSDIVEAAASALGKIGSKEACKAIGDALKQPSGKSKTALAKAYLMCAEKLLQEADTSGAKKIYNQLYFYSPKEAMPIRIAALRGIVNTNLTIKEDASEIIIDVLKEDNAQLQAAAIALIADIPGTKTIKAAAKQLSNLPAAGQVQLLSALAERGDSVVLPAVVTAAKSGDQTVKIEALKALMHLGNASSISLLAQTSAESKGQVRNTARQSLYRLPGANIDKNIIKAISKADPKIKVELIAALGQRNATSSIKTLLKTAKASDAKVRIESFKALKIIAGKKQLPDLINLLIKVENQSERKEAEKTIVAVSQKIDDRNRRAKAILKVLPSAKDIDARCSLMSVLGKLGDDNALPVLLTALKEQDPKIQDAAVRALCEWPNAEPASHLSKIVQTSDNKKHKVLALRGFVRLIGLESDRPADTTVQLYKQAMDLASSVNDKKMVLSGLANIKSVDALEMAAEYLDNKDIQQEAGAAAIKIAKAIQKDHPKKTKAVLQKVVDTTKNDFLRKQAKAMLASP